MTYKELYESAADKLEKSKITLGEFEKMIEPLNTEIDTDSDTISRQAAIKALDKRFDSIPMEQTTEILLLRRDLRELPPAQPERHWIPVTEATPTEDDDYWATFEAETGRFVDWASWYQGRWVTWIEGSPAPLSNVIAWCKPMEPYKGVTT